MATNAQIVAYSSDSLEALVDIILNQQELLSEAHDTIDQQADLIIELQGQLNGE